MTTAQLLTMASLLLAYSAILGGVTEAIKRVGKGKLPPTVVLATPLLLGAMTGASAFRLALALVGYALPEGLDGHLASIGVLGGICAGTWATWLYKTAMELIRARAKG